MFDRTFQDALKI